jgi:hypothetical protein
MVITVEPGIYFIEDALSSAKENHAVKDFINFDLIEEY